MKPETLELIWHAFNVVRWVVVVLVCVFCGCVGGGYVRVGVEAGANPVTCWLHLRIFCRKGFGI